MPYVHFLVVLFAVTFVCFTRTSRIWAQIAAGGGVGNALMNASQNLKPWCYALRNYLIVSHAFPLQKLLKK